MSNRESVVVVKNVNKSFKLPHEQSSGLKDIIVNFLKRKKGYETQHVLEDISFEIPKGEFFGIVGRNGSGKSTLLKLIGGIYSPDKGSVYIGGSLTPFIELGVGFNPELTGRENIYLNGALLGFSRNEIDAMYGDIVKFAELERFMDQKLKNYSSGMQVRLAFSIAIRAENDILLIDEVLAVGDSAFQQKCFDYFNRLKREGKTIILVTHDMASVKRFCTSAIYIKKGKITVIGKPSDVADVYLLENLDSSVETLENTSRHISRQHGLDVEATKDDVDTLELKFTYHAPDMEKMYIAFSILRDGISIAEMTTYTYRELIGKGETEFTLNKQLLNPGVYELTCILCNEAERKLLTLGKHKIDFVVKGDDITRGAALRLPNTWR